MKSASRSLARAAAVALAAGGVLIGSAAMASAAPPNCTAADVTAATTGVSAAMTTYLFTHPDVNDFFTGLQGLSKTDARQKTKDYLAANPQVRAELDAIRAPGVDLRNRCGIPQRATIAGAL